MIVTSLVIGLIGLCLGSFVNALVWRVHEQEKLGNKSKTSKLRTKSYSILKGRSMCPSCQHELSAKDLIPVLSWFLLGAKCRYCRKPISVQYPLVEVAMAVVFVLSYLLWPQPLNNGQGLLLGTWLAASIGLMALLVYDLKWMLLPNRIIYPTFFVALTGRLIYIVFYSSNTAHAFLLLLGSILVASGLFWLIFVASRGNWIGYGDVRLGLVTGTLLASPALSLLMIFTASILGTIAAIPGLASHKKTMLSKMPFGPFLILATGAVVLFGQSFLDWYAYLL